MQPAACSVFEVDLQHGIRAWGHEAAAKVLGIVGRASFAGIRGRLLRVLESTHCGWLPIKTSLQGCAPT